MVSWLVPFLVILKRLSSVRCFGTLDVSIHVLSSVADGNTSYHRPLLSGKERPLSLPEGARRGLRHRRGAGGRRRTLRRHLRAADQHHPRSAPGDAPLP